MELDKINRHEIESSLQGYIRQEGLILLSQNYGAQTFKSSQWLLVNKKKKEKGTEMDKGKMELKGVKSGSCSLLVIFFILFSHLL